MKPAVLDASPLIILAKAAYLPLLPKLLSPVVIPRAVATEISTGTLGLLAAAAQMNLPPSLSVAIESVRARGADTRFDVVAAFRINLSRILVP